MNCNFKRLHKVYRLTVVLLLSLLLFVSCDKFESSQTVPAYIRIDSIGLFTDYDEQGTASNKIVDAWIYVDDNLIGAFELPVIAPVLQEGIHKVEIRAGIKINGIAATRAPYPMYEPIVIEDVMLVPDSIVTINQTTTYYDNVVFAWMEDFESLITIEETAKSDTAVKRTNDPSQVFEGGYSGIISLTSGKSFYEGAMAESSVLPTGTKPVFLELNFKLQNEITTGLFSNKLGEIIQEPIINLNTTSEWKKIYINYTPAVNRNSTALSYKIYLAAMLQSGLQDANILIDNIKLVYRDESGNE